MTYLVLTPQLKSLLHRMKIQKVKRQRQKLTPQQLQAFENAFGAWAEAPEDFVEELRSRSRKRLDDLWS